MGLLADAFSRFFLSQGIERPKRSERKQENGWPVEQSEHIYWLFAVLYGCDLWYTQTIAIEQSKITDHR